MVTNFPECLFLDTLCSLLPDDLDAWTPGSASSARVLVQGVGVSVVGKHNLAWRRPLAVWPGHRGPRAAEEHVSLRSLFRCFARCGDPAARTLKCNLGFLRCYSSGHPGAICKPALAARHSIYALGFRCPMSRFKLPKKAPEGANMCQYVA